MTTTADLSKYHELVGDMFPTMSAAEAWEKYKLSEDQVNFFKENGYLHNVKIIDESQVDKLNEELSQLMDPDHPGHELFYEFHSNESGDPNQVLFHSLGHWRITKGFHDILWNPRFVVPACQLLGNKAVRFWHDQLFCKPAKHGGVVAWHQDYSYWTRTEPLQHLTCWVALDDSSIANGCLQYVPKSHRWNLLDRTTLAGAMNGLDKFLTDEQKKQFAHKVPIEMKRGYGSFHHPLLVHGSYGNDSPFPRRAFVLNVFADGTISNSNEPPLAGVPSIEPGKKMEGQFFPLLFDPKKI
jgi:ectoine hydroxylase-related dioxygenase (phytanoyl-CoA dioxygenase family)